MFPVQGVSFADSPPGHCCRVAGEGSREAALKESRRAKSVAGRSPGQLYLPTFFSAYRAGWAPAFQPSTGIVCPVPPSLPDSCMPLLSCLQENAPETLAERLAAGCAAGGEWRVVKHQAHTPLLARGKKQQLRSRAWDKGGNQSWPLSGLQDTSCCGSEWRAGLRQGLALDTQYLLLGRAGGLRQHSLPWGLPTQQPLSCSAMQSAVKPDRARLLPGRLLRSGYD